VLHARPDAAQVDGRHAVEALGRFIAKVAGETDDAGVVECHVQPTVGRDGALDHPAACASSATSQATPIAWRPAAVIVASKRRGRRY
jgi:hypothetical protein